MREVFDYEKALNEIIFLDPYGKDSSLVIEVKTNTTDGEDVINKIIVSKNCYMFSPTTDYVLQFDRLENGYRVESYICNGDEATNKILPWLNHPNFIRKYVY